MARDSPSYIIRRNQRFRVNAWSKKEAIDKARKGEDCILLTDKWR